MFAREKLIATRRAGCGDQSGRVGRDAREKAARAAVLLESAIQAIREAAEEYPDAPCNADSPDIVAVRHLYRWHDRLMDDARAAEEAP